MRLKIDSLNDGWVWHCVVTMLLALFLAGAAIPAWAVQATLLADAHVSSARPTVNSGAISNLNVGAGYTALIQFDLGMLPGGTTAAQVSRAVLTVYCNRVNTPGQVSVQAVNGGWGEYSVTYSTLPVLGSTVQGVTVSQAGTYIAVDVTSLVQGWIATPAANNGLALTAMTADLQFDSKENDQTGHAPSLDITLAGTGAAGPAGAPGSTGAAGALGPQGLSGGQGPQGIKGIAGSQGPMGSPGVNGLTGPAGPGGPVGPVGTGGVAGAMGPAGAPGLVYLGNYSSVTNYALGDVVLWQGASYASLFAGNHGNTPGQVSFAWGVLTAQGQTGVAGPQGLAGITGPQGLPGFVGPPGGRGCRALGVLRVQPGRRA